GGVPRRAVRGGAAGLAALAGKQSAAPVLCHSVLEYVDSPPAAMAAIAAVLRPGGAVSVLTASAVAAVIHRALAGRFDEARRLLTGIGTEAGGNGDGSAAAPAGRGPAGRRPPPVPPRPGAPPPPRGPRPPPGPRGAPGG